MEIGERSRPSNLSQEGPSALTTLITGHRSIELD